MFAAVNVTVIVTELVFANTKKSGFSCEGVSPFALKKNKKKKGPENTEVICRTDTTFNFQL